VQKNFYYFFFLPLNFGILKIQNLFYPFLDKRTLVNPIFYSCPENNSILIPKDEFAQGNKLHFKFNKKLSPNVENKQLFF
jgi:hypothetical protein